MNDTEFIRKLLEFPLPLEDIQIEVDAETEAENEFNEANGLHTYSTTLFRDQFLKCLWLEIPDGKISLLSLDLLRDRFLHLRGLDESCAQEIIATCDEISFAMQSLLADVFIGALQQEEDLKPFLQLQEEALQAAGPKDRDELFLRLYVSNLVDEEYKKQREEKLQSN